MATVVFADLVGSTGIFERLGDEPRDGFVGQQELERGEEPGVAQGTGAHERSLVTLERIAKG